MDQHNKLYLPISMESRSDRSIAVYICQGAEGLQFQMVDLAAEECYQNAFDIKDISSFFDSPLHQVIKAYIFNVFEIQQFNFAKNLKLQDEIIAKMHRLKVPYNFMRNEAIFGTTALLLANVKSKIGETVLVICVIHDELIVYEYLRQADGYVVVERRDVDCEEETNQETLKTQILGSSQPTKIIVALVMSNSNKVLANTVKNQILKSYNNIILQEYDPENSIPKFTAAVVNHMFDKRFNEYHILPRCHSGYAVSTSPSPANAEDALIVVNENDALPIVKSCMVPRIKSTFYISYLHVESKQYKKIRTCKSPVSKDYHQLKLTLIIVENNIPFLYQEKVNLRKIEALPSRLDSMDDLDIPVIGYFDNSAVICIKKEDGYKFLDSFNGVYGNDLFLSFHQEKPSLITEADTVGNSNTAIKASDIIQVMSMPCDNIISNPKWNFIITSDDEYPVLCEFINSNGSKSAASPAFLMALILKQLVKLIKKEIGRIPEKLGITIFDEFDEDAKKKRVKAELQEACNLLKIDSQIL